MSSVSKNEPTAFLRRIKKLGISVEKTSIPGPKASFRVKNQFRTNEEAVIIYDHGGRWSYGGWPYYSLEEMVASVSVWVKLDTRQFADKPRPERIVFEEDEKILKMCRIERLKHTLGFDRSLVIRTRFKGAEVMIEHCLDDKSESFPTSLKYRGVCVYSTEKTLMAAKGLCLEFLDSVISDQATMQGKRESPQR